MAIKYSIVLLTLCIGVTLAAPPALTEAQKIDKATANDVDLNTIATADKTKLSAGNVATAPVTLFAVPGSETTTPAWTYPPPIQRGNGMISKFISDIFQIPISVLQSVTRLLTNPFAVNKDAAVA